MRLIATISLYWSFSPLKWRMKTGSCCSSAANALLGLYLRLGISVHISGMEPRTWYVGERGEAKSEGGGRWGEAKVRNVLTCQGTSEGGETASGMHNGGTGK